MGKGKAYIKYIAGLLLFGSNGVAASFISLNSYEIVLLRSFLGSLMLLGIFLISGQRFTALRYKRDFVFIALSGVAMASDWLFLFEAYAQIGVSLSLLINYSGPVIVMALSPLMFQEQLTLRKVSALLAALAGLLLIVGAGSGGGFDLMGFACAVLSAFSYVAMVICNKKSDHVIGMENSLLQLLTTLAVVAVFVGVKQGFAMNISPGDRLPILWLGFINTGIGCCLYFSSIGSLPVQTVAICGYLEPLSAMVMAALILKETMLPVQYLGAVLIIGGALLGEGVFKRK